IITVYESGNDARLGNGPYANKSNCGNTTGAPLLGVIREGDFLVRTHHVEYCDGGILDPDDVLTDLVEDKDRCRCLSTTEAETGFDYRALPHPIAINPQHARCPVGRPVARADEYSAGADG
ncbi:putative partitioning defective 3-like protein B, partial [Triplophysa rosa]